MEVAAAVGVIVSVPIIYKAIRPKIKTSVECWFCHTRTKVHYNDRNSFTCTSCDQYNGFTEDGGYNRRVPGQQYTTPKQFCELAKKTPAKPNGILHRFNGVNMSPKAANGLCAECNLGQEIIMKKVADFEPVNEDRWNEELEDYRYKLERMYQLCSSCTLQVHHKLETDKKEYSYLLDVKYKLKRAIGSTLRDVMSSGQKSSRKLFLSGGSICEALHFGGLSISVVLFLANMDFLQQDAGTTLINFPKTLQDQLPAVYENYFFLNVVILFSHLVAIFNNKCRFTLPDLLLPILSMIAMISFLSENLTQDMALFRAGCSSFIACLSMAVTFLPRKRLHKKRPNKIISSAFSVASTPISQCSSQASRNASLLENETTIYERNRRSRHSPSGSPPDVGSSSPLLRDITNGLSWSSRIHENKENRNNVESMDWDDSESVAQSTRTAQSHFRPGLLARSLGNGMNPQELTPSVASMNLFENPKQLDSTPSIFSRQHRQMVQQQQQSNTPTRSLFGPPRSMIASQVERNNYMSQETNTRPGSVFTSVSQQDGHSMVSGAWQCRIIGILIALVLILLIMQIGLFYFLFTRN